MHELIKKEDIKNSCCVEENTHEPIMFIVTIKIFTGSFIISTYCKSHLLWLMNEGKYNVIGFTKLE